MSRFKIFNAERLGKIFLYLTADVIVLNFSLLISVSLWYTGVIPGSTTTAIPPEGWNWFGQMSLAATLIGVAVYAVLGMYNNLWKYASMDEVLKIFIATTAIFISLYFYNTYILQDMVFRRVLFVAWTFNTILFTASRFGYRAVRNSIYLAGLITKKAGAKRVMVVGAGYSGYGIIRGMRSGSVRNSVPVIVVDDEPAKNNTLLMGVRVLCGTDNIPELVERYLVDEIVIAIPSATRMQLKSIIDNCTKTDCSLKIMPPISDVSEGVNTSLTLRDVNISDLLYRDEIILDVSHIRAYLTGRVVLITGGGGSIGSELCRQIAKFEPSVMVIFDIYENNAYTLVNELKARYKDRIEFLIRIGSVRDSQRVEAVFEEFKPEVVFHAAAHKHVPLMEDSPAEAVKNNVFGTYNVAEASDRHEVDRFVLLSTDKAVNPANVMGATKRITELITQKMAAKSKTRFMAVRFGNVLGSNGSVIPLFQKQISNGGPVTVTHPEMVRFFMTIPEAAQLVLQAAATGESGRIFVLDMGSPVKIDDLARNLIKLSGLQPGRDIEVVYTGLRPGEKLYEELVMSEEETEVTHHKKIFITAPVNMDYDEFERQLDELWRLTNTEPDRVVQYLHLMLPNFISG